MLATGWVKLLSNTGAEVCVRALFDTGGEVNIITEKLVKELNLKKDNFSVTMKGITGNELISFGSVNVQFTSWFNACSENLLFKSFIVMRTIPIRKNVQFSNRIIEFKGLEMADPAYNQPGAIELLLGVDVWAEIIQEEIVRTKFGLCAQKTKFGYTVFGAVKEHSNIAESPVRSIMAGNIIDIHEESSLDQFLQRFWEIEEMPDIIVSEDDQRAEEQFRNTVQRAANGRYIVKIPLHDNKILGSSESIALQQFYQLERRLQKNDELSKNYMEFMQEFIDLGHMRLATSAEKRADGYYIPHHAVTSRFRVVFNASSLTTNGKSFNDIQLAGSNLQDDLDIIIMRFRSHKYVLSADIKKMFRQIELHQEDLKYQKIFWRFNQNEKIKQYVLLTVIYGMKSSPFLANRIMIQLAEDYNEQFPLASYATKSERYMDDYMSGADTKSQLLELYNQLVAILDKGKFELGKWKSNCSEMIEQINGDFADQHLELNDDVTSILGLKWQPSSDCFTFQCTETWADKVRMTKRRILSTIARIYDPCGFLAPIIIDAKTFMQSLWTRKVKWDEDLTSEHMDLVSRWEEYHNSLQLLNELKIPRWYHNTLGSNITLHGFSDASNKGYGAVIYVCSQNGVERTSTLLLSKTRVAPIKQLSIPRLELNAAVLLAKLKKRVQTQCGFQETPCILLCDSNVVLSWLKLNPASLKTYVGNRVIKILKQSSVHDWCYVNTKQNPADIASRGMPIKQLIKSEMWWHGPEFLVNPTTLSEQNVATSLEENDAIRAEQKPLFTCKVELEILKWFSIKNSVPLIEHFASFGKVIRVTAFTLLAVQRFRCKESRADPNTIGLLSLDLLKSAELYWVKFTQLKYFNKELQQLVKDKTVDKSSSIAKLCPFIDTQGIIRVGGRLSNAELSYDEKFPTIIPPHSAFCRLIIKQAHCETFHGGVQQILHYVRVKYWIVGMRRAATRAVKSCNICRRYRKKPLKQLMGNLPKERVTASRPFANCGVDYFGPINVKRFSGRCKSIDKGYGAVFVCLATRMVHVECVSDLTTQRFLWALQRLAAIYRMPSKMFSDNAKTFKGAAIELKKIHESWKTTEMEGFLNSKGTSWQFITPRAPFQGGIWEAAVKATKFHMKRILHTQVLTFEQYQTLFAKISAVLNSRPMVPLNDDPIEINYLTPAHAMIGEKLVQPLAYDLSEIPINRINQQKLLDKIQQDFWSSFKNDYLSTVQNRYKWNTKERNLNINDIVLIKEDHSPPGVWPMGRVIQVFPGTDGVVRNVRLKTESTELNRAVRNLVSLKGKEEPSNITKAD